MRLHEIVHTPGALESDQVWHAGLARVWKGLVSGGRLRSYLPLPLVVSYRHVIILNLEHVFIVINRIKYFTQAGYATVLGLRVKKSPTTITSLALPLRPRQMT